ncbi:MAG TPA: arsenate reductase ArsC [Gammaproteobacteria bacterium]|nr:arsenate reductase ArsC [Gammaproteobacteria bacterium]
MTPPLNVLFLCTGNSARSILGEALLRHEAATRGLPVGSFSAGSHPTGQVNPLALQILERLEVPTEGLASKTWDAYASPDAPTMHLVITVCDAAAGEACPLWPGTPAKAHWGLPDPAGVEGDASHREQAFVATAQALQRRLDRLLDALAAAGSPTPGMLADIAATAHTAEATSGQRS